MVATAQWGFGCDHGSCTEWHQGHVVRHFSVLCSSCLCLVYGAFVAAGVALASILPWELLSIIAREKLLFVDVRVFLLYSYPSSIYVLPW